MNAISDAALVSSLDDHYATNIWDWACDEVVTLDEAMGQRTRWPRDKAYLRELLTIFEERNFIAVPKSRRMMVTWAAALWAVWRARYHSDQKIFIQSDTESKAAFVVDQRCAFIEDHLRTPGIIRRYSALRTSEGQIGKMVYQDTDSWIQAIAQGEEKIRGYTYSALISDEIEHQQEGHKALTAALPALEKDAKLIMIGTSNGPGGVLAQVCESVGFTRWAA